MQLTTIPAEYDELRSKARRIAAQVQHDHPDDVRARSWLSFDAAFSRKLGAAGLLGLTLPPAYGGAGQDAFARFVVVEELLAVGAPVAAHWIADRQSAPLILHYGTEAQRQAHLPSICRGENFFCIGMSEPGSGSDLASVRTRATPDGDGWILNGTKLWTTNADHAHHMIALVRTSGEAGDRHQGLSQLIIDLKLPGITIRPIDEVTGDAHFCEVHFEDVRLGPDALVGTEGDGWKQVTAELAYERSGPERIYSSVVLLDAWIRHLAKTERLSDTALRLAGKFTADLAVLREVAIAVTGKLVAGESPVLEASLLKDLGTSLEQAIPTAIADDLGSRPDEMVDPSLVRTLFFTSQIAPSFSLRGGTREILRGIIARGLGLR
nr:acyl-CoA dehydrogenase family protein [Sphingobium sp. Sx8-8]